MTTHALVQTMIQNHPARLDSAARHLQAAISEAARGIGGEGGDLARAARIQQACEIGRVALQAGRVPSPQFCSLMDLIFAEWRDELGEQEDEQSWLTDELARAFAAASRITLDLSERDRRLLKLIVLDISSTGPESIRARDSLLQTGDADGLDASMLSIHIRQTVKALTELRLEDSSDNHGILATLENAQVIADRIDQACNSEVER